MNIPKPHNPLHIFLLFVTVLMLVTAQIPVQTVHAKDSQAPAPLLAPVTIYGDSLASQWQDWSWDATRNLRNTSPRHSGSNSISITLTKAWGALYLHGNAALSTSGYTHLEFYIHGGTSGSQRLNLIANRNTQKPYAVTAPANRWAKVSIPLSNLGSPASLTDLFFQDALGKVQPKFYIDTIALVASSTSTLPTATPTKTYLPTVTKTAAPINPTATPIKPTATPVKPTLTPTRPAATQPPVTTKYFTTLPPGSKLPSDAECAAMIKRKPENKRVNAVPNATVGNQRLAADYFGSAVDQRANTEIASRVTGNFTGTTDEILQWAACKWGIDEDMVRAQTAIESWWRQNTKGDWTSDSSHCAPGHGLGVDGQSGQCPESWGVLQTRYPYRKSAWPSMLNSTAFNADLAYSEWRACYEGYEYWLNDVERGKQYAAGDAWGCFGRWFSGRWHTQAATDYINRVKEYHSTRIWESANFQEP